MLENDGVSEKISGISCWLELGGKTKKMIEDEFIEPQKNLNKNDIFAFLARKFIGTQCFYETSLDAIPNDQMRVRITSFDCVTFIYFVLALSGVKTFSEFVEKLYKIRYIANDEKLINNDPMNGNFYDFVCESLILNSSNRNYLKNITANTVDETILKKFSVKLQGFHRKSQYDQQNTYITPKYGERDFSDYFIPSEEVYKINYDAVLSGDIVLFTRGGHFSNGEKTTCLIYHLAIIIKENGKLCLLHATRNYYLKPEATKGNPHKISTGYYYLDDPKNEQIGVGFSVRPAGDEHTITVNSEKIYCYLPDERFELKDYAMAYFKGVSIWRSIV